MTQTVAKKDTKKRILAVSYPLFAKHGYNGVSLRDISSALDMTTAALYYHFKNKEQLYIDVIAYAYEQILEELQVILTRDQHPWEKFESLIERMSRILEEDRVRMRLVWWMLLDNDEDRQEKLIECVFKDFLESFYTLISEINTHHDTHMLSISIIGLLFFYIESLPLNKYMPGYSPHHETPAALAEHVLNLVCNGIPDAPQKFSIKGNASDKAQE